MHGKRGQSSKEAFPEEVAPQEVEYEMTRSMSEGWRGIEAKGRCTWGAERELANFGHMGWAVPGVGGSRAGEAVAFVVG